MRALARLFLAACFLSLVSIGNTGCESKPQFNPKPPEVKPGEDAKTITPRLPEKRNKEGKKLPTPPLPAPPP